MMKGLNVQAQTVHSVCTAIDQRGEQTINKDAKTSGMSLTRYKAFLEYFPRSDKSDSDTVL